MTRWSTVLLDEADLHEMGKLPLNKIFGHADAVVVQEPTPRVLYERWEKQQWSADAISLDRDKEDWDSQLRKPLREALSLLMNNFIVGEYTALDRFAPLMASCPDEESLLFLGTQAADEARHMRFMGRLANELLELPRDLRSVLPYAWSHLTPANRELNRLESQIFQELNDRPGNYAYWLRLVTLFHLVTEGVLALHGQRQLVASLRRLSIMPGTMAGFTGMTRDESRHVGFGVHALQKGILEGYQDEICEVVEQAAPLLMRIELVDNANHIQVEEAAKTGRAIREVLRKRLHQLKLPLKVTEDILTPTSSGSDGPRPLKA